MKNVTTNWEANIFSWKIILFLLGLNFGWNPLSKLQFLVLRHSRSESWLKCNTRSTQILLDHAQKYYWVRTGCSAPRYNWELVMQPVAVKVSWKLFTHEKEILMQMSAKCIRSAIKMKTLEFMFKFMLMAWKNFCTSLFFIPENGV